MPDFNCVKDSGARQNFETGSVRDTRDGKGRFDLLPPMVLRRDAAHMEHGAVKYGDHNWTKGQPLSRYLDSAFRHLICLMEGQHDEDHAAAVRWNIGAFMWTQNEIREGRLPSELDDLYWPASHLPECLKVAIRTQMTNLPRADRPAGEIASGPLSVDPVVDTCFGGPGVSAPGHDPSLSRSANRLRDHLSIRRGTVAKLTDEDRAVLAYLTALGI